MEEDMCAVVTSQGVLNSFSGGNSLGRDSAHGEYGVGKFVEVHRVLGSQPGSLLMNISIASYLQYVCHFCNQ